MNKFDQIRANILSSNETVTRFISELDDLVNQSGNKQLIQFLNKQKKKVALSIDSLENNSKELYAALQNELSKRTERLNRKITELQRAKEAAISNNFFLEFKKKDLLQLTADLESAYEEITEQSNEIKLANDKIMEKNREMEIQYESLLAQTDYLHEANETITHMHEELQTQREEILNKNIELLNLNNEKNNLIGIVAHDLKSPLNQIKGFIGLIRLTAKDLDTETSNLIGMIEASTERLSNMISKILDIEAIDSRKPNMALEPTNVSELLRAVSERFKMEAQQKEITLHYNIKKNSYATIDKSYTDQIFQNLISNAIKFSPKNKNIFIHLESIEKCLVLKIQDEGPGISPSDMKKLFGKYQRLSAKPTGGETSTGLGLSIVKKFVEHMNGKIWVESEEKKGATFYVSFNEINPV